MKRFEGGVRLIWVFLMGMIGGAVGMFLLLRLGISKMAEEARKAAVEQLTGRAAAGKEKNEEGENSE